MEDIFVDDSGLHNRVHIQARGEIRHTKPSFLFSRYPIEFLRVYSPSIIG